MIVHMLISAALAVAPAAAAAPQKAPEAKNQPPATCRDHTARLLWKAGFRDRANRIAWSITWRESHHQNLDESSPWYTGALGMWQVQTSAHSGKSWWSRDAMLDPKRQSRLVYRHMTNGGRNWAPWGLTPRGDGIDGSAYGGWSAWQRQAWIWGPYMQAWGMYPRGCRAR